MKITQFTIATTAMHDMLTFYDAVFESDMHPIEGSPFYLGKLADTRLLFCPNSITQIQADKNRIQLQITVDDVDALVEKAERVGGSAFGERSEDKGVIAWAIADPDGNTIELVQRK